MKRVQKWSVRTGRIWIPSDHEAIRGREVWINLLYLRAEIEKLARFVDHSIVVVAAVSTFDVKNTDVIAVVACLVLVEKIQVAVAFYRNISNCYVKERKSEPERYVQYGIVVWAQVAVVDLAVAAMLEKSDRLIDFIWLKQ